MHVLEGGAVVVAQGHLVRGLDEEGVVQAVVANVVGDSAHGQSVAVHAGEVGLGVADAQQPVDAMRDVDCMEPVVIGACLGVALLDDLEETRHKVNFDDEAVVVGPEEIDGGRMNSLGVKLEGVDVPRVEEVQSHPGVVEQRLVVRQHPFQRLGAGLVRVRCVGQYIRGPKRVRGEEAVDERPVQFAEVRHVVVVADRVRATLVVLVQGRQLPNDLGEEAGLVLELLGRLGLPVLATLARGVLVFVLHVAGHVGDRLENHRCRLPDLHQQLLERDEDDGRHPLR
mmetsp:Transcript_53244/g.154981  ORF Transcript_53244/g.154981 Transcript_53244/m.154981 type:complete len:284 (-) Transcript_53244:824-1675(-)